MVIYNNPLISVNHTDSEKKYLNSRYVWDDGWNEGSANNKESIHTWNESKFPLIEWKQQSKDHLHWDIVDKVLNALRKSSE